MGDLDEFLTTALLRQRYKKTSKTIRDWELAGILPPAERINGRKYWLRSALEQREREGMSPQRAVISHTATTTPRTPDIEHTPARRRIGTRLYE